MIYLLKLFSKAISVCVSVSGHNSTKTQDFFKNQDTRLPEHSEIQDLMLMSWGLDQEKLIVI